MVIKIILLILITSHGAIELIIYRIKRKTYRHHLSAQQVERRIKQVDTRERV